MKSSKPLILARPLLETMEDTNGMLQNWWTYRATFGLDSLKIRILDSSIGV